MDDYRNEIDEVFRQMRNQVDEEIKNQIIDEARIGPRTSKAQAKKMESLWTRYEEINTRTLQELGESTLVNDTAQLRKLMETGPRPRRDRMLQWSGVSFKTFDGRPIVVSRQVPSETDESWEQAFQWTVMPAPISLDSVLRMANVLGIDREMKSIAQLLHDDYSFRWKRTAAPMSDLLREYKEIYRLTLAGENVDDDALSSRIDFRYDLYDDLLERFKELDAEFIDQYETLLDQVNQPLFALWKLSRQLELVRPALLEGTSGTYSLSGLRVSPGSDLIINRSQTRGTDLFIFLLDEFDSADWVNEETIATLSDYYAQSTVVISSIHSASMQCRRMLEDIYSEQVGVGVGTHVSELDTSMWGETMGRLCQENKHLLNLDRRTLELFRFKRHEMDDAGNDLLDRYLARAFPRLVPDAGLEIWLRNSLDSVRIDQSQRTGIEDLYTSYVQENNRDTHEMLSLALETIMQYSCDFNAPENLELTRSFLSSLRAAREKQKLLDSNTDMRLRVILGDDLAQDFSHPDESQR
ncbi:MAG: hypothetical protein IID30_11965 [Planctomycetes bacterium]|nr:hypothetical protein [Planctomycetota bacterium]